MIFQWPLNQWNLKGSGDIWGEHVQEVMVLELVSLVDNSSNLEMATNPDQSTSTCYWLVENQTQLLDNKNWWSHQPAITCSKVLHVLLQSECFQRNKWDQHSWTAGGIFQLPFLLHVVPWANTLNIGHRWFVQDHHANGAKNEATTNRISFSRFSHVPLPPPGSDF